MRGQRAHPETLGRGRSAVRRLSLLTVIAAAIAGLGYLIGIGLEAPRSVEAVLLGCGVSWLAAVIGALPGILAGGGAPHSGAGFTLAGMGLRFLLALFLGAAAAASGRFPAAPLLLALAATYVALLITDTLLEVGGSLPGSRP